MTEQIEVLGQFDARRNDVATEISRTNWSALN